MQPTKKEQTHERILDHASRAIRRAGYEGVGVAALMKEAGLTHGGFYAHFESRDDLVVEALSRATDQTLARMTEVVDTAASGKKIEALADRYLQDSHVKNPGEGCALAALGSETHRQPAAVRAVVRRQVKDFLALIERSLPEGGDADERRDRARLLLSALVGSLVIARAVDNAEMSKAVRGAVKRFAAEQAG
jgi:TetR/AcrR family transcriptional regulator, transcriptional repressor for nem operon